MQKTTFQHPEILDDNGNPIQTGPYGKNTPYTTYNNRGALDYINNNLEWLFSNKLDKTNVNSSISSLIASQSGLDKTNVASIFTTLGDQGIRTWADWNSENYSPDLAKGFWRYVGLTSGGGSENYNGALALKTSTNELFVSGGYTKQWKRVETVGEFNTKYIRYDSGLQITFESINSGAVNVVNGYTFPAAFVAVPIVSVDSNSNIAVHATSLTATGCNIQLPNNTTARTVHIIAIGRWK